MTRLTIFLSSWLLLWACAPLPAPLPLPFLPARTQESTPVITPSLIATGDVLVWVGSDAINIRSSPDLGSISSNVIAWGVHDETMKSTGICHIENRDRTWVQVIYKGRLGWVAWRYITFHETGSICSVFE